jgi:hypothetical protein
MANLSKDLFKVSLNLILSDFDLPFAFPLFNNTVFDTIVKSIRLNNVDASLILTIKSGLCRLNFDQVISRILPIFGAGANWSDYHGYVRKNSPDVFSGTSDNQ